MGQFVWFQAKFTIKLFIVALWMHLRLFFVNIYIVFRISWKYICLPVLHVSSGTINQSMFAHPSEASPSPTTKARDRGLLPPSNRIVSKLNQCLSSGFCILTHVNAVLVFRDLRGRNNNNNNWGTRDAYVGWTGSISGWYDLSSFAFRNDVLGLLTITTSWMRRLEDIGWK